MMNTWRFPPRESNLSRHAKVIPQNSKLIEIMFAKCVSGARFILDIFVFHDVQTAEEIILAALRLMLVSF